MDNLADRGQYLNAAHTFKELLALGAVPVVNENDTVAVAQLRIGDNDTLSAQVATLVHAEWLFLLTDVDALYTANPSDDPDARPIREVPNLWDLSVDTSTKGTQWGTGGMATKITAARMATAGGCNMAICHYKEPRNVIRILEGEPVGTVFTAASAPVQGRKRWVLAIPERGAVWLDPGAVRAVRDRRSSLFSVGIIKVVGDFEEGDAVRICDHEGREFARGLVNYCANDVDLVKGMSSSRFLQEYGSRFGQEEIVHRASISLLVHPHAPQSKKETKEDEDGPMSPPGLSRSGTPAPPLSLATKEIADAVTAQLAEIELKQKSMN